MGRDAEVFYGYVYDDNGYHNGKQPFYGTAENVANFIMMNKDHDTVVTDIMDCFVVSSMRGGFLDRVASMDIRDKIMPEILPLQMGEKQPVDVVAEYRKDTKSAELDFIRQELETLGIEFDDDTVENIYEEEFGPEFEDEAER